MKHDIIAMIMKIPLPFWKVENYHGMHRYLSDEFNVEIIDSSFNLIIYIDGKKYLQLPSFISFMFGNLFAFKYNKLKRFLSTIPIESTPDESIIRFNEKLKDLGV